MCRILSSVTQRCVPEDRVSNNLRGSRTLHVAEETLDDAQNVIESLFHSPDNMPPKGPTAKDKDIAPVEEDVIQAVILAESFNKRFKPLTIDRPRAS